MAGETSKNGGIIWVGMAIVALVPISRVRSAVDREMLGIMVPGRRHPCILRVAGLAVGWEIGRLVVRVVGLVVIIEVTSRTGIGCVIVITVVAGSTLIRDGRMSSHQRIIIVVHRKLCGVPSGRCGVALNAVCR